MGIVTAYVLGLGSGLLAAFTFTVIGYRVAQQHNAQPEDEC